MARGSKIAINRSRVDGVMLAVADGMFEVGKQMVEAAATTAPDYPTGRWPINEGLPKQGGVLAYYDGKKVAGYGLDGRQPRPPRAARVSRSRGIIVIVGWGFPARFNEFGTVKMPANPFFTPAADRIEPQAVPIMTPVVSAELGSKP